MEKCDFKGRHLCSFHTFRVSVCTQTVVFVPMLQLFHEFWKMLSISASKQILIAQFPPWRKMVKAKQILASHNNCQTAGWYLIHTTAVLRGFSCCSSLGMCLSLKNNYMITMKVNLWWSLFIRALAWLVPALRTPTVVLLIYEMLSALPSFLIQLTACVPHLTCSHLFMDKTK